MARKSLKERTLEALLTDPDPRTRLRAALSLDRIDARKMRRKRNKPAKTDGSCVSNLTGEQLETFRRVQELEK
jgi:hypothetical protein